MATASVIALYVTPLGRVAHLAHPETNGAQQPWCKRVKWEGYGNMAWLVTAYSGYPVCKSCLKIAKHKLGIK